MGWFTRTPAGSEVNTTAPPQPPPRGILGWLRSLVGGWPGPAAAKGTPAAKALEAEKVRSGPSGVTLPAFLPYFDDQTNETAAMRRAYRGMLADPNVFAALLSKVLAVASLELKIQPANKRDPRSREVAEFVEHALLRRLQGGVPSLVWSVLSGGMIDGISICERDWQPETRGRWAGKVILDQVKPKDVGNDIVPETDEFRNIVSLLGLRYNGGQHFLPNSFVIYRHLPLFCSPVGMSGFRPIYSRYWMADTAWKLRAVAVEKRAMGLLIGSWKNPAQRAALEAALGLAKSQAWVSLPEGVKLEVINLAASSETVFQSFCKDTAEDIWLGLTGATLQALTGGQNEQRGSSKVHKTASDLVNWWLSEQFVTTVLNDLQNGLIVDLVDLNFVVSEYPKATLAAVDVQELLQDLQVATGLHGIGLDLSKEELYEKFGYTPPSPANPDDVLKGQQAPGAGGSGGAPGGPGAPPPPGGPPSPSPGGAPFDELHAHIKRLAEGVPAKPPFRFSEAWRAYLAG